MPGRAHALLHQEIALLADFTRLLERESRILRDGAETQALAALTAEKNRVADLLADAANQRNHVLVTLGHSPDKAGLDQCRAAQPQLAGLIDQLLTATQAASQLNTQNGQIIHTLLQHNQRALDTLQHLGGESPLYDAHGRATTPGPARPKSGRPPIRAG